MENIFQFFFLEIITNIEDRFEKNIEYLDWSMIFIKLIKDK